MAVTETPLKTADTAVLSDGSTTRPQPTGLAAVLGSGDHKVIGRLYIVTSLIFGLVVVALGQLMAVEAIKPATLDVFDSETVFQFFTLYRVGSLFLLAFPLVIGVALVVVPLQIGARSVAFPRAAAASYWAWLIGSGLLIAAYAMNGGPAGGRSDGVNLWIASLGLIVVAIVLAAISLATTVLALRAPGVTLARVPLFSWSVAVAAIMWILTLPVLLGLMVLLYVDHRHAGTSFGANAGLFDRIAWVFRNPQVYVVAVPVLGFTADVVATTARARIQMRGVAQAAIGAFGALGFGAFLLAADATAIESPLVIFMGLAAVVPVLAILGLSADVVRRGSLRATTGAVYALSGTLILLLGVAAGALGSIPALETSGTIFDLGVSHAVILGAVIAAVGGIHWWSTKIGRQGANEALGRLAPVVMLIGAAAIVIPDLVSGIAGKGNELNADWTGGIDGLNTIVAIGTAVLALGMLIAVVSLLPLLKRATQVERDPWTGQSLEWLSPSPPPLDNFDAALPLVTSAEPLIDQREEK